MKHHFGGAAAVAAVAVLLFSSCGGQQPGSGGSGSESWGTAPQQPPRTTTPPSSSPVPSPSKPQPSETFTPEQLEAANTVIEYFRISDEVSSSLDADPQPLKDITTGQTQEMDMNELNDYRQHGQIQTGTTIVRITGAADAKEENNLTVVTVQTCTDTSKADVVDSKTGKSIFETRKRSMYLAWNIDVVKTGKGWKIGDATNDIDLGCHS